MERKARILLLSGLMLSPAAVPTLADDTIRAGIDVWETQGDGRTYVDLALPAGFFCAASAPFSGRVTLVGVPIATSPSGVLGKTDTVVERLSDTTFDASGVATVNAVVRAVSFKSTAPVTVSGCVGSASWDVRSVASPTQSPFVITIRRSSPTATGGSFDSSVSVTPRLIFTQQGSGLQRILDQQTIVFTTQGAEWTHAPAAGGVTCSGTVQIDTDGNSVAETTVPCPSNFSPGCSSSPQPNCSAPPCRVPIPHQAPQHSHWVWPPPPRTCTATASCEGGVAISCQSNVSATSCSAVDRNCSIGEPGHVTCGGVTTYCPTSCWVFEGCWSPFPSGTCYDIYADGSGKYWRCKPCGATTTPSTGTCVQVNPNSTGYWCS